MEIERKYEVQKVKKVWKEGNTVKIEISTPVSSNSALTNLPTSFTIGVQSDKNEELLAQLNKLVDISRQLLSPRRSLEIRPPATTSRLYSSS